MSSTPNPPGETQVVEVTSTPRWVMLLFAVAFVLVAYLMYASYAEREALRKTADDSTRKVQALGAELGIRERAHCGSEGQVGSHRRSSG